MNKDFTFEIIGKELNIPKYACEDTVQYHARITYSAIGMWIRMLSATQSKETKPWSKSALHRKISEVLQSYIRIDSELVHWFYPNGTSNPIKILRNTLFRAGDLIECGFDSRVKCANERIIPFSDTQAFITGYQSSFQLNHSAGLACTIKGDFECTTDFLSNNFQIPLSSAEMQLKQVSKTAKWEKVESIDNYEIFDPTRKKILSSCWVRFLPMASNQLYIARSQYSFGMYDYQLIKYENNIYYRSSMSAFSQHELVRDTQRLLYAYKAIYGHPATVLVDKLDKYTIWHFWSKLPPAEEFFLRYIGWPLENIENTKNEYLIRNEFSYLVETIVKNLNIEMEEHIHE